MAYLYDVEELQARPEKETFMTTPRFGGILKSAYDALMASRHRASDRTVSGVLLRMDDETLRLHGFERKAIRRRASAYHLI
jgi:hypothetical protein